MGAMKSAGAILLGVTAFIAMLALPVIFINGAVWVSVKVMPLIQWATALAFLACIVLIPCIFIPATKAFAAVVYLIMSHIFGLGLWMFGLIVTYSLWGVIPVIAGLFFFGMGVVPFGMVAAMFNGEWYVLVNLLLGAALTFGTRALATFLATRYDAQKLAKEITLTPTRVEYSPAPD